jgi:hypothetical protein
VSKEFIKSGLNKGDLNTATRQERQLSYFTQSSLQDDTISESYLSQWADRKYQGKDYFLNFVKAIFKTENFLSFYKYLRHPIPSAKLINNKVKPQLNRVFVSENADFKYDITNVQPSEIVETLGSKDFQEKLLNKLLYKHNSILIEDMDSQKVNEPYRYFLNVDKVLALAHNEDVITHIAYNAVIDNKVVIIYIDSSVYAVYDKEYNLIGEEIPHDLGRCPANFISKERYKDGFIIRESIFTYIREELEEYVFLKTLQKMSEPNGAIPVLVKLATESEDEDSESNKGEPGEPNSDQIMGSQKSGVYGDNNNKQSGDLQTGTIHEVPLEAITADDGKIDMEAVKSYLNFFYTPVEALKYMKDRISEIENSIISTLIGTMDTSNEESKNEMQVEKSIIVLENTLIYLADNLNKIRRESDYNMLALKYGPDKVNEIFIFYGTDFFLESQSRLFEDLAKAPNPIERKNILIRINQNKYKNNQDQMVRQKLLYDLLPYTSDKDFEIARNSIIDAITLQYQLRFNYWVGVFEAEYGDIVSFFKELDADTATRLLVINNLIIEIIKKVTVQEVAPS